LRVEGRDFTTEDTEMHRERERGEKSRVEI
jgi:hypothetical protein